MAENRSGRPLFGAATETGALASAIRPLCSVRAEALSNLGNLLATQGEPAAARRALEEAVALDPGLAEAENNLGRAIFGQGDASEATAHFDRALSLNPNYVELVSIERGCFKRREKMTMRFPSIAA